MKRIFLATLTLAALASVVSGCRRGDLDGIAAPISRADLPDLTGLIDADNSDGTAVAAQLGEPATLRQAAIDQAEKVRGDVASVLRFLRENTDGEPTLAGQTEDGRSFGVWEKDVDGVTVRVLAIRVTEDRVRIIVAAKNAEGLERPLFTGVFVKKGEGTGGGRFHISLTNVSDLFSEPGQGHDGSVHFVFANHREDLRGRRVAYLNVDDRSTAETETATFGADLVRIVGVGGRFRSIYAAELIPELAGLEALGMRTVWRAGEGGRADVIVATQDGGGRVIGHAHECWDVEGLRTAYADTMPDNDAETPNEGDVTSCHDLAQDDGDEGTVTGGGTDSDEELDQLLDESGANDITEDEADEVEDPAADEGEQQ